MMIVHLLHVQGGVIAVDDEIIVISKHLLSEIGQQLLFRSKSVAKNIKSVQQLAFPLHELSLVSTGKPVMTLWFDL